MDPEAKARIFVAGDPREQRTVVVGFTWEDFVSGKAIFCVDQNTGLFSLELSPLQSVNHRLPLILHPLFF